MIICTALTDVFGGLAGATELDLALDAFSVNDRVAWSIAVTVEPIRSYEEIFRGLGTFLG
jgi:hypothetical protein